MRGNPHSYQAIAHEDPGYYPSECEGCHEAAAEEYHEETDQELCESCFDELETSDTYDHMERSS